jgi:hypothetical protein
MTYHGLPNWAPAFAGVHEVSFRGLDPLRGHRSSGRCPRLKPFSSPQSGTRNTSGVTGKRENGVAIVLVTPVT